VGFIVVGALLGDRGISLIVSGLVVLGAAVVIARVIYRRLFKP
jgi:hypothetical protein